MQVVKITDIAIEAQMAIVDRNSAECKWNILGSNALKTMVKVKRSSNEAAMIIKFLFLEDIVIDPTNKE